ncbi:MAG: hypothetical protein RLZ62_553 [Bacteroidota bacterium]
MKYLICTIAALSFLACGGNQSNQQASEAETLPETHVSLSGEQMQNAKVETGTPEKGEISAALRLSGTIDVPPQNMVSVSFPLGGYLKSTRLLPGMRVRKGEVLAVMEDAQFIQLQQDYLLVQSKLTLAEAEFQRQQALNAGKAASDKVLQQAKSEYETQRIMQRALAEKLRLIGLEPEKLSEENLSRTVSVYSPINGYVSRVDVNIGKYTAPTDVLFELVNPQDIHLNLTAFEKDVQQLAIGQRVTAWTNDKPEKKFPASIILVGKNLDENRSAEVHCHFDRYDEALLPGMYMNAEVSVKSQHAWIVPEAAVVRWHLRH